MSAGDVVVIVSGPVYAGPDVGWLQPPEPVTVSAEVADQVRLTDKHAKFGVVGEDVAHDLEGVTSDAVPLEDRTVVQLREYAAEHGIAVPASARTKPAILTVLTAGTAADPEVLEIGSLDDEALLDLAAEWGVEPGDAERDELVTLLTAHRATNTTT